MDEEVKNEELTEEELTEEELTESTIPKKKRGRPRKSDSIDVDTTEEPTEMIDETESSVEDETPLVLINVVVDEEEMSNPDDGTDSVLEEIKRKLAGYTLYKIEMQSLSQEEIAHAFEVGFFTAKNASKFVINW